MSVLTLLLTEFLFIGALDWTLNGNYKMVERLRPDMAEAFGINQQQSGTENERVEMLGNISVRPEGVGEGEVSHHVILRGCQELSRLESFGGCRAKYLLE